MYSSDSPPACLHTLLLRFFNRLKIIECYKNDLLHLHISSRALKYLSLFTAEQADGQSYKDLHNRSLF